MYIQVKRIIENVLSLVDLMEVDLEQDSCQQQGVTGLGKQGGKSGVCARIHISFCVAGDEAERTAVLTAKKKQVNHLFLNNRQ